MTACTRRRRTWSTRAAPCGRGGARRAAAAARADAAGPRRRGRVPAGRPLLGPAPRQRLRPLLRRPAPAADRASSAPSTTSAGSPALRVLGALACARRPCCWPPRSAARWPAPGAGRWGAVVVAALCTNPLIDPVAVKGELLALPLVLLAGILAALRAARRAARRAGRSLAGLVAADRPGVQAEPAGGLVFGAVLLLAAWATSRLHRGRVARLGAGRRCSAPRCRCSAPGLGPRPGRPPRDAGLRRARLPHRRRRGARRRRHRAPRSSAWCLLVVVASARGCVLILAGFLVHVGGEWRDNPAVTLPRRWRCSRVEVAWLVAGGSYWRDYLFPLVPSAVLVRGAAGPAHAPARAPGCGWSSWLSAVSVADLAGGLERPRGHPDVSPTPRPRPATRSARRRSPATPWSSSAAAPTCSGQRAALAVPVPVEPADAHPGPRVRRPRAPCSPGPTRPTWLVEWVAFERVGPTPRAARCGAGRRRTTSRAAPAAGPAGLAAPRRRAARRVTPRPAR